MTLAERMSEWALRHRDAALDRVQVDRGLTLAAQRLGTPATARAAERRQRRTERRVAFWDDLFVRLAR